MVALATTHIAIVSKCCVSIVDRCTGISFEGIFVKKTARNFNIVFLVNPLKVE